MNAYTSAHVCLLTRACISASIYVRKCMCVCKCVCVYVLACACVQTNLLHSQPTDPDHVNMRASAKRELRKRNENKTSVTHAHDPPATDGTRRPGGGREGQGAGGREKGRERGREKAGREARGRDGR